MVLTSIGSLQSDFSGLQKTERGRLVSPQRCIQRDPARPASAPSVPHRWETDKLGASAVFNSR